MSLAARNRVASTGRRRHYADESGHVDGGPYHIDDNDEGQQEEVFISDVPGKESVAVPGPGDAPISNTENNLVAHKLQQRIQQRNAQQRRDLIAWEQVTGRRLTAEPNVGVDPSPGMGNSGESAFKDLLRGQTGTAGPGSAGTGSFDPQNSPGAASGVGGAATDLFKGQPGSSAIGEFASGQQRTQSRHYAEATEIPDQVNPSVQTGPGGNELTGDGFESLGESPEETQPRDASIRAFRAFDNWLTQTTGRTARQHGNASFIRRSAARFCQAAGLNVESLFPALGIVLREARRNEGRSAMRRRADEKLEVAAPQDRIDVETPVRDTTDAEAQASQFDLGDFGDNASDNLADPNLDTDSQIWAPGETPSGFKSSNRKADGITAVRYAEAFIAAGLAPNTSEEKWKIAGLAQTMRHGTIVDRTRLLDAINTVRRASIRRTAGTSGAGRGLPQNLGQRQLTAGTYREAAGDIATDQAIFFK